MPELKDRRVILGIGAGLALATGLGITAILVSNRGKSADEPAPASQGGLIVQTGHDDDIKLDPARPLHCYVGGKLVGDLPLSECARRNGVAPGALDVGLDPGSGELAASGGGTSLTPLPPADDGAPSGSVAVASSDLDEARAPATSAACWRYDHGAWRRLPVTMGLDACVQHLFGGRCPVPDMPPTYGRWGASTLRLTPGEVDISDDNREFRSLAQQGADCAISPVAAPE